MPRGRKIRRAQRDGDVKEEKRLRAEQKFVDSHQVGEGCERCPEHSLAACFGDKCATKCCGPDEVPYRSTQVVPMSPNMTRNGGKKTRRKRRKKRRKSRKKRKKTKRRRKKRRKKSKKVRRK